MEFPEPVIDIAIEPKDKANSEKMSIALAKLAEEDPTFKTHTDQETGQTIIAGMGELHLDIIVDRLKREFKVECTVGKPQVSYKETIRNTVKVQGKFVRQSGGHGQYGDVWIEMEPLEPGSGIKFESKIVGGAVPKEYIKPVEEGIREAAESGILAGYPVIDFKATLVDGSYHEVDSSEMAFKIAASMAFKEACKQAKSVILEPIMRIKVVAESKYTGNILSDLNTRRARIQNIEEKEHRVISLTASKKQGMLLIEETNYFNGEIKFNSDGSIKTTKKDNAKYHGYGTKSIAYIVKKYEGKVEYEINDHIFKLRIVM